MLGRRAGGAAQACYAGMCAMLNTRKELRRLIKDSNAKGKQYERLAATMMSMYRKDPQANEFLREEARLMLRRSQYHLRQAAVIEALLERDAGKRPAQASPRPGD